MKKISITAIIEKSSDGWYVGQIEEFPEAVSQGKTVKELQENLIDALTLVMEAQREITQATYKGRKIIRRKLNLAQ
ncbi:MAG: type II toxin-antitoxin system HicB family antitoxin [Bacteroidetes bacterium]|nr:type II toxin-antitoxin system HicB family antitoxin [Bacteroidota bacterium]MCL6101693.1 type II toxin-antitoxin system HicB family antitoxin [Bacteroidota bacterium]